MNPQNTVDTLKAMRFSAMANEFERQLSDLASYGQLGFEDRFALLVDAEWNRRQQNKLARIIHEARFAQSGAEIEDIEYHADRKLDKVQILRFATCKYIEEGHHIILKGASGSGKTFLACALGNAACRKFKKVRYIRLPELLEELGLAHASGELKKALKAYRKADLLILDEWLIRSLTPEVRPAGVGRGSLPSRGDDFLYAVRHRRVVRTHQPQVGGRQYDFRGHHGPNYP